MWEWHAWDHLVQDRDPSKDHYGDVTAHPELIDVNADHRREPPLSEAERRRREELEREMRALGYLGDGGGEGDAPDRRRGRPPGADWLHVNSVDYHPGLDLVLLSVRALNEIWVIDHSTTTAEAAGHAGGRHGRGGDLLYRWGNPATYGHGERADRRLFLQHDATWVPGPGPGALHVLVFNNGVGGAGPGSRPWSSVDELALPYAPGRGFARAEAAAFGPAGLAWSYAAPERESFFAPFVSGAQRLPNGNTLIASGVEGRLFEVSPAGELLWDYRNPFGAEADPGGGRGPVAPGGLFRATRLPADHPGIAALLQSSRR